MIKKIKCLFLTTLIVACSPPPADDENLNELPDQSARENLSSAQDPEAVVDEALQEEVISAPQIEGFKDRKGGYIRTVLVGTYENVTVNDITVFDEGCGLDYIVQDGIFHEEFPFVMEMGKEYEIGTNCDTRRLDVETDRGVVTMLF